MRLAGTWKQYSTEAISQLTTIAFHSGDSRNFRCPYQANVINTFEIVRRIMVRMAEHLARNDTVRTTAYHRQCSKRAVPDTFVVVHSSFAPLNFLRLYYRFLLPVTTKVAD